MATHTLLRTLLVSFFIAADCMCIQAWIQKIILRGAHWTSVAEDDEARRQRREGELSGQGVYPLPRRLGRLEERRKLP